jgi:riboflavin kinase/FMN adenylyltransferase
MKHHCALEDVTLEHAWLTIGVYDGVHRGHKEIIRRLTQGAHAIGAPAVVLTFDPHPAVVLSGRDIKLLTTPVERAEVFTALGLDELVTVAFTTELSQVSAFDFMSRLKKRLGVDQLLIGYDFALGKGREGNTTRLIEIGRELDYQVQIVAAVSDESGVISSTEIRKLVSTGDVAEAARLLGHPYTLRGKVVHGDGRGHRINIPTANMDYPLNKVIPSNGIYACWAYLGEEKFKALINIGINPTFTPDKQTPNVEAHLLDFDRKIYDQVLKLDFVERLRDEKKFASVDALVEQIHVDIDRGRQILT